MINKLMSYLVRNSYIEEDEIEVYEYSFRVLFLTIFDYLVLFIIALIFNKLLEGLLFLTFFIPLRSYAGGYHADSPIKCLILSAIAFIFIINFTYINYLVFFLLMISAIVIIVFSPIESENNPLSDNEHRNYRRKTKIILIIELIVMFFCMTKGYNIIVSSIVNTIILTAILLVLKLVRG